MSTQSYFDEAQDGIDVSRSGYGSMTLNDRGRHFFMTSPYKTFGPNRRVEHYAFPVRRRNGGIIFLGILISVSSGCSAVVRGRKAGMATRSDRAGQRVVPSSRTMASRIPTTDFSLLGEFIEMDDDECGGGEGGDGSGVAGGALEGLEVLEVGVGSLGRLAQGGVDVVVGGVVGAGPGALDGCVLPAGFHGGSDARGRNHCHGAEDVSDRAS